jgi:hypothetical protein
VPMSAQVGAALTCNLSYKRPLATQGQQQARAVKEVFGPQEKRPLDHEGSCCCCCCCWGLEGGCTSRGRVARGAGLGLSSARTALACSSCCCCRRCCFWGAWAASCCSPPPAIPGLGVLRHFTPPSACFTSPSDCASASHKEFLVKSTGSMRAL